MVVQKKLYTPEAFERITQLPENAERRFELVAGEIIEVVSSSYASMIAMYIGAKLLFFVDEQRLGRVTGADGGYVVGTERYIPDAALMTYQRQPEPSRQAYNPLAPDLAVEVMSPTDDERTLRIKLTNYLAAGTVVWVVLPDVQEVEIHAPGQPAQILSSADTLTGGDLLPGFTLAVADIFNR